MSKKEKSLKRLRERIKKVASIEKRANEIRERKHRQEELRRKKAEELRYKWYNKHEAKAKKAANVIWKWYEEFITSSMFQEIVSSRNETNFSRISISRGITCRVPSGLGREWERVQWFTIDIRTRELFVHTAVKYGRSNKIDGIEDLLECVELPILITVGDTITNDTIWDIINVS